MFLSCVPSAGPAGSVKPSWKGARNLERLEQPGPYKAFLLKNRTQEKQKIGANYAFLQQPELN
jgi:hypothetical protein